MSTVAEKPVDKSAEKPEEQKVINQEAATDFVKRLTLGSVSEPKVDDKKPVKAADTKPAKAPVKKVTRKIEALPSQPVHADYEKIAEASARGVASALQEAKPKVETETEKQDDDVSFLTDDERVTLRDLGFAAKFMPAKYKDHPKQFILNKRAEAEYIKQWEKDNAGQKFDKESSDHDDFYAKHELDWKDSDLDEASKRHYAREELGTIKKEYDEKLSAIERREQMREFEPKALSEGRRNARSVFDSLGDDFKGVINEDGVVSKEAVKKMWDENPTEANIVTSEVTRIEKLCSEAFRLFHGVTQLDPKNPDHAFLQDFAEGVEKEMLALPKEDQVDSQGRQFVRSVDYAKLSEKQRAGKFTLSSQDFNDLLSVSMGSKLREQLQGHRAQFEAYIKKKGYVMPDKPSEEEENREAVVADKPKPVGVGADARVANQRANDTAPRATDKKSFMARFIGGR